MFIDDNFRWIIILICIRISSLPYRYDVNALGNGRSNGIMIDQLVKITNHGRHNISK